MTTEWLISWHDYVCKHACVRVRVCVCVTTHSVIHITDSQTILPDHSTNILCPCKPRTQSSRHHLYKEQIVVHLTLLFKVILHTLITKSILPTPEEHSTIPTTHTAVLHTNPLTLTSVHQNLEYA